MRGAYWPWFLTALLVGGVVLNVAMVLRAADDPSFAIEPDYYQKAIDWDASRRAEYESQALGWSIELDVSLERRHHDGCLLVRTKLKDKFGRPIADADLSLDAVHLARSNRLLHASLSHHSGDYSARLPGCRPGLWEFSFVAERGGERFLHKARVNIPAPQDAALP